MAGKMMKLLESLWKQANLETLPTSAGAAAAAASAKSKKPKSMFNKVVATCSVYLLYWYKSTNTETEEHVQQGGCHILSLLALLVQKYEY